MEGTEREMFVERGIFGCASGIGLPAFVLGIGRGREPELVIALLTPCAGFALDGLDGDTGSPGCLRDRRLRYVTRPKRILEL